MYNKFGIMLLLSFPVMFILMYLMVEKWKHVDFNFNQLYMTLAMITSMGLIEIFVMKDMYADNKLNMIIITSMSIILIISIIFTRKQVLITDKQFLRSMIPHHSGAILMCKNADIKDQDIKKLCNNIIKSQQSEINWMENKLNNLQ